MKTCFRNATLIFVLMAALGLMLVASVDAQTYTMLHAFGAAYPEGFEGNYNSDGMEPEAGLVLSGKTLYGTTPIGTTSGSGAVFAINTDGSGFTNLHVFGASQLNGFNARNTNSDGLEAYATLILCGNTLYGTTTEGTSSGVGTVFAVNTDGTGFTNLHNFSPLALSTNTNTDGAFPDCQLLLSGNVLYGTARGGGTMGLGTVFAMNTDGSGFTNLHNFTGTNDGASPLAGLILLGNTLYGTASGGGSSSNGTIFAVNTDGSGFTNLHNFTGGGGGFIPRAPLILSGSLLYGSAATSQLSGDFTLFALNTNGQGFTNLYNFTVFAGDGTSPPFPKLCLLGSTLFGAVPGGGAADYDFSDGFLFALNTKTLLETELYGFPYNYGEWNGSSSELVYSNFTFYGTTIYLGASGTAPGGESAGVGSVFSLSYMPHLKINTAGPNVILSWPTNVSVMDTSALTLQFTTSLNSPVSWTNVSPSPSIVNGLYTVTNAISGAQMFYRLAE